jgi:hypothetical protein
MIDTAGLSPGYEAKFDAALGELAFSLESGELSQVGVNEKQVCDKWKNILAFHLADIIPHPFSSAQAALSPDQQTASALFDLLIEDANSD